MAYTIPATYLPVMARESVASPIVFGWRWPVFGFAAFASTLFVTRLRDGYSNRQIWAAGHVVMAAGLLLPVALPNIVAIAAAGFCVGGSFMVVTMVGMREAHRNAPPPDVIRHIAAMTTAFAAGQVLGPLTASAWFAASGNLSGVLVLTSVLLLMGAFVLVQSSPQSRRNGA
jgi:predicted MFS family arabinose efflux permease